MQDRRRYRFHGESLPMMTTRDSYTFAKPKPTENTSARRRRPPTLKEMNEIARAFWARSENRP